MITPFVDNPRDFDSIKESRAVVLYNKLKEAGSYKKLSTEDKEKLNTLFNELWHPDAYRYGVVKLLGWRIDFSQWLNRYWVKDKYYGIREIWSFNKTFIRKNAVNPSHIMQIIEVQ